MNHAFHTITFVRQAKRSVDNRNQPPRTSGSRRRCDGRLLPIAALALLCGWPPAVLAQATAVPGGYVQLYPGAAAITQGQTVQLRAAVEMSGRRSSSRGPITGSACVRIPRSQTAASLCRARHTSLIGSGIINRVLVTF